MSWFASIVAALSLQTVELTPSQEMQAGEIMREIRCVVCEGQSIADSDAPLAQDMRAFVRQQVGGGANADSVRIALASRYGDEVLMRPRLSSRTWPLYVAPLVFLLFGGLFLFAAARRRRE